MVTVYRVREINAHRLSAAEATLFPAAIAWRVISARRFGGRWEYIFDDLVIEPNLPPYLAVASDRGAERITFHRLGLVADVIREDTWRPMRGTTSIAQERKNHKLEEYHPRRKRSNR